MSEAVSTPSRSGREAGLQAPTISTSVAWFTEHFWVVDVARAFLSIALGVIVLSELAPERKLTSLVFFGLGLYLLADGVMDIIASWVALRRRDPERSRFVSGLVSAVVGAGTLIAGQSMVVLILAAFGLRLCVYGLLDIWRSISSLWRRHTQPLGYGERFAWLPGIWRITLGVALIALSPVLYLLAVIYFGAYLLIDGLFSLNSAAQRRSRTGYVWRSEVAGADVEVPVVDPEHPERRRAVVFVRRSGASGLGHVSWAFEWQNGWFNAGSVENVSGAPFVAPDKMGFWTAETLDPVTTMLEKDPPYDEFKIFFVDEPHSVDAWRIVVWVSRIPYAVHGRNCADCAYDVLRSFGLEHMRDPAQKSIPNEWYDSLPGLSYRIADHPVIPLRPDAVTPVNDHLREIPLKPSAHALGHRPSWRAGGGRAIYELRQRLEYINEETLLTLHAAYAAARRVAERVRRRIHDAGERTQA